MQPNIFLTRTKEQLTCGITNIPLTKPSIVWFRERDNISLVYEMFESLKIPFIRSDNNYLGDSYFASKEELDSKTIKLIWRNFKSLHPKFTSNWRYLFWEIDEHSEELMTEVISLYNYLKLPVYIHKTMRGYHFICVKPIEESVWQLAVNRLRKTNISYPPITLRINPNKYIGEDKIFNEGFVIADKPHSDTKQIRDWIINKNYERIGQQYQLVYYPIDKKEGDLDV